MNIKVTDLGEYLKKARLEKNLSIKDTAARIRVSLGYIGKIEKGVFAPSLEIIAKLCNCYDIPLENIIGDDMVGSGNQSIEGNVELDKVLEATNLIFSGKKIEVKDSLRISEFISLLVSLEDERSKDLLDDLLASVKKFGN